MSNETLIELVRPILDHLAKADLSAPDKAIAELNAAFPPDSAYVKSIRKLFSEGIAAGWLCDKKGGAASFSRVAKTGEATKGFSIDAVRLEGPGVWHRHTTGEVDLCFSDTPDARFDGFSEGWVVFAPGSAHVPTSTAGAMNILYFIPNGALQWTRDDA